MSDKLKKASVTSYGTNARERLMEIERSAESAVEDVAGTKSILRSEQEISTTVRDKCCVVETEPCAWLDFLTAVIFTGYCVFLVWLLAHTKGNIYYNLLNLVAFFTIVIWSVFPWCYDRGVALFCRQLRLTGVVAVVMITFTMLTRTAFYHLSLKQDIIIGKTFVVVSLKGCIAVFLWAMLARKRFSLTAIKADKHLITQVILDNVDIFSLAETLSLSHSSSTDMGKNIPVPLIQEGSPLEIAIQTFCTLAFVVLWIQVASLGTALDEVPTGRQLSAAIVKFYKMVLESFSLIFHNIPFLVIRLFVWFEYKEYDIGLLSKNFMAIALVLSEIRHLLSL